MVRIVRLADLGRRLSAAVPVLVLAASGVGFAAALTGAASLDVPDQALTSGASPRYPSADAPPPPMQLPPIYDTYTTDWPRQAVAAPALSAIRALLPVRLDAQGIPAPALTAYHRAADLLRGSDPSCGLDWALLAAIGRVESNHARFGGNVLDPSGVARPGIIGIPLDGRRGTARITDTDGGRWDRDRVYDRAVGPMQFIPGTWRSVAADGDGDGVRDPQDLSDAATAAGLYLCSGRAELTRPGGAYTAVLRYNHSDAYARTVLSIADAYRRGVTVLPVGALPAARPAPGSGTATPEGSGFGWGGTSAPASSSSSSPTTKPTTRPARNPNAPGDRGGQPSSPATATTRPAPDPSRPALRVPEPPLLPTTAGLPLPSPVPATTLSVEQLLALPHLPPLLGDPSGLVRVVDPISQHVICLVGGAVVDCP